MLAQEGSGLGFQDALFLSDTKPMQAARRKKLFRGETAHKTLQASFRHFFAKKSATRNS
ncbi:MAG: hypothetical protein AAGU04_00015 [Anaerolineaceae bacterium]|jgi:hypothetical protein